MSHHTTNSCRPKESPAEAPLTSLSAAGLDDDEPAGRPGEVVVRIRGQNLIRNGDNLGAAYESPPCRSGKEARSVAALEYLSILFGAAPNEIRLPPKCFKRGSESVAIIREAAQAVLAARSALPSSQVDIWA